MNQNALRQKLWVELGKLKDFQIATVEHLYQQYRAGQQRLLCADEVGLGKTLIARGILSKMLLERIDTGDTTPLKVAYICSNQILARSNLQKLKPLPQMQVNTEVSRLSFLAWQPENSDGPLELLSLTPSTSFHVTSGNGAAEERKIIYNCLANYADFNGCEKYLATMLQCGVTDGESWRERIKWTRHPVRRELPAKLRIRARKLTLKLPDDEDIYDLLPTRHQRSLYSVISTLCQNGTFRLNARSDIKLVAWKLSSMLRTTLVDACTKLVKADLFVLDEFQRFRDLVDGESDIAAQVIHNPGAKLLLLSATPTRPYQTRVESGENDQNHADFRKLLEVLHGDEENKLRGYDNARKRLRESLLKIAHSDLNNQDLAAGSEARDDTQEELLKVMARTERASVAKGGNAMVISRRIGELPNPQDIESYVATDHFLRILDEATPHHAVWLNPLEFCKTAPFPLSFMHGYKVRSLCSDVFQQVSKEADLLSKGLKESTSAWVPVDDIETYRYQPAAETAHARFRDFLDMALDKNAENLLWIPPSLPYFALTGSYAKTRGFSKTLVFSNWALAPRMLSTLTSYELERRTIGQLRLPPDQPKSSYGLTGNTRKQRLPRPEIRYGAKTSQRDVTLLHPCLTLARLWSPGDGSAQTNPAELLLSLESQIQEKLNGLQHQPLTEAIDTNWYALAPVLLDEHFCSDSDLPEKQLAGLDAFQRGSGYSEEESGNGAKESDGSEGKGETQKLQRFRELLQPHGRSPLGTMPSDLAYHLARLTLGAPAIIGLRSLLQYATDLATADARLQAINIAESLITLYNKPESICAIRQSRPRGKTNSDYREMILDYAIEGCLQAVIDEYLYFQITDIGCSEAVSQLVDASSIRTSNVRVDWPDAQGGISAGNMRCHYAMEFGTQTLTSEAGQKRAVGLREVFNSPFRPFVLASTSVGQEGLDFHRWCRRIVHWNLPGNPVDLEQREGRINRYMSLSIRQELASRHGDQALAEAGKSVDNSSAPENTVWGRLTHLAEAASRTAQEQNQLIPFWHLDNSDHPIERVVAATHYSRDEARGQQLRSALALYRLTFGQPRPADLMEYLQKMELNKEQLVALQRNFLINLSPWKIRRVQDFEI